MTTDTTGKSLISGGNSEVLRTDTPAPAPTAAEVIYADKSVEGEANPAPENKTQTPEEKATSDTANADQITRDAKAAEDKTAADKIEADRIAALTPGEKKAHDDKLAADKKAEEDKAAAEEADKNKKKEPVDLTDMALPEGFSFDEDVKADLTKVVNDLGLDVKTAEALAPVGAKIAENAVKKINDGYDAIRSDWREQVAKHPVLGSKEAMAIADKGLEAYGSPALRLLLDESGIGDHPAVIEAFHKIGLRVGEDVIERGGSGDKQLKDAADAMYPTMK